MGFAAIFGLLSPMFSDLIKRIFPDPEKQAEAEARMQELLLNAQVEADKMETTRIESQKDVITTEINSGWAGNWRAYIMLACTAMLVNSWIITPLLNAFLTPLGCPIIPVPIPPEAWTFITVGLGGYLGKETMATYSNGKVEKAKAENTPAIIDEDALAKALRKNLFPQGMTQPQWDAILKSTKDSVRADGSVQ